MKRNGMMIAAALLAAALFLICFAGCKEQKVDPKATSSPAAGNTAAAPSASPTAKAAGTPKPVVTPAPPEGYDANIAIPKAGIFDVVFENGAAADKSVNALTVEKFGEPDVKKDESIGREVASFTADGQAAFLIQNFGTYYDKIKSSFSQEIYFKSTDVTVDYCAVAANMEAGGFGFDFEPDKNGFATFGFSIRIDGAYKWAYPEEDMEEDTYIHAVAVYDGTDLLLYVNGELAVETKGIGGDFTFPENEDAQFFVIGGDSGSGTAEGFYTGDIALVRLYDEALDANQIYKLYTEAVKKE